MNSIWQDMKTRSPANKNVVTEKSVVPKVPIQNSPSKTQNRIYECDIFALHINTIIAKGREHKVHVFLVSQTHLATETGISTAMRRSIALVGQGRLTADGNPNNYSNSLGLVVKFTVEPVPEPSSTLGLLAIGILGAGLTFGSRKRRD